MIVIFRLIITLKHNQNFLLKSLLEELAEYYVSEGSKTVTKYTGPK